MLRNVTVNISYSIFPVFYRSCETTFFYVLPQKKKKKSDKDKSGERGY